MVYVVGTVVNVADDFEEFFDEVEPRLRRAFAGGLGVDRAHDATAEALAWAWANWERVQAMSNPAGYLYRVGLSKTRRRKTPVLPPRDPIELPDVEPDLVPALLALTTPQRTAVWLVHGCGWTYGDVGVAMDVSASAVGTHVRRALQHLRGALNVVEDHA